MPYASLSGLLKPGHPRAYANDSLTGSIYAYHGATTTIDANIPGVGEVWADGNPVVSTEKFQFNTLSARSELIVVTGNPVIYSGTLGTPAVEETLYELEWRAVTLPLEVHPVFRTSGTYAIDATGRKHILGWKAELNPTLKSERKYKPLNSYGLPVGAEVTISGNALEFIKLLEIGVEEYIDYAPIWRKRSMYRGSTTPPVSTIGQKGTPSGSGYPTGYEWVKSKDSAQRVGRSSRWRRDEEWEGAKVVWVDIDEVFPPA